MDFGAILSTLLIFTTGVGGWLRGRTDGQGNALNIASDTVGMLSIQLSLKEEKINELTRAYEALARHHQECQRGGQGPGEEGPANSGPADNG